MIINHNLSAQFASRSLNSRDGELSSSIEKLSSGMRINRSSDDASGLAVAERMRSQIRGLGRASKNVQDGIAFIQIAEGYLAETTDVIQRIRELAIQAANGIYSSSDREFIQAEIDQLVDEVDRVAEHAQYNSMNILTGRFSEGGPVGKISFHIGANVDQNISLTIGNMSANALGLSGDTTEANSPQTSVLTAEEANRTLARVDSALEVITKQRTDLGAVQNRMNYLKQGLNIGAENLQAAESGIRDSNMAEEISKFVRARILTQSSTAMLAQANAQPNVILSLLNG